MGRHLGSFLVLNLPFFDLLAQRAFRICHLQWSLTDDVPSKALVAKNLTQYGGGLVILNSSAGPTAASEKTTVTRTVIHQLSQLSPATSQQFNVGNDFKSHIQKQIVPDSLCCCAFALYRGVLRANSAEVKKSFLSERGPRTAQCDWKIAALRPSWWLSRKLRLMEP